MIKYDLLVYLGLLPLLAVIVFSGLSSGKPWALDQFCARKTAVLENVIVVDLNPYPISIR